MPNVRNMDRSFGVSFEGRWIAPPTIPMCEPAQVLDGGENRGNEGGRVEARAEARTQWPFLYSYNERGCTINTAPRRSAYSQASDAGEALM
jgi:hypothetical protein